MHPLQITNTPDVYELTPYQNTSWKSLLFALLGCFLLVTVINFPLFLLFGKSPEGMMSILLGIAPFFLGALDVLAVSAICTSLFHEGRTRGPLFSGAICLLLLMVLICSWWWRADLPVVWLGRSVLLFVSLFLVTYIGALHSDRSTRKSIRTFLLTIFENRVLIGTSFTIGYQLSLRQVASIKILRIKLAYEQYVGTDSYGQDSYTRHSLLVHQRTDFVGEPAHPILEEFQWAVPAHLSTFSQARQNWRLIVLIKPRKGSRMWASYPLTVISTRPVSDEQHSHPVPSTAAMASTQALETPDNQRSKLLQRGKEEFHRHHYEKALKVYEELVRLNALDAEAHLGKSGALFALGRLDKSLNAANTALHINPDYGHAHYNRGVILASFRNYDLAMASLDQALRCDAHDAWALAAKSALLRIHTKDYDGALSLSTLAIASEPDYVFAYLHKFWALLALKRHKEAKEALAAAKQRHPPAIPLLLAQCWLWIRSVWRI